MPIIRKKNMNFASYLTLLALLTGTLFISGECLKCYHDCESYYERDGTKSTTCQDYSEISCDGSCFHDHQTTFEQSNFDFSSGKYTAVTAEAGCSPKMKDGCVPYTTDNNPEITKRCFCNTDLCY